MKYGIPSVPSMPEVYLNAAGAKLFEGITEFTSVSDGNEIAILALGDWEAEGERAGGGVALALFESGDGEDFALAVLNGDWSGTADVGVSVRSLARCSVCCDRVLTGTVDQHELS